MPMMNHILLPQEGFKLGNPTWKQFCEVIKQPKKKAPGPDKISPHLLQRLPKELQSVLAHFGGCFARIKRPM